MRYNPTLDACPLTVHPGQIIGWVNGRPVRAIAGGAPDDDETGSSGDTDDQQDDTGATDDESGSSSDDKTGGQGDSKWDGKIESLPGDVQKVIERYKTEAANASSKSRENARKEAQQEILEKLGLVKGGEKPDPDQLAKDLADARTERRQARIELEVFKTAGKHQGDANALLDSRSFLAKVSDFDPTASDFAAKVDAAIKDAVKDNPKLKAGQVPGASSVDTGRTGERRTNGKTPSLTGAVTDYYGT